MKSYSPYQFSFFRIILGIYLCIHFIYLIPYAPEIWSDQGLLPDPTLNFTYGVIPNLLYYLSGPLEVSIFVGVLAILSFCFLIGFQRPVVALLLWYGWVCLFDRNNLISNPGIPYVGWILLCCVVIPKGEPLSLTKNTSETKWTMPLILFVGAWVLMSLGYTISGIDKFQAPSWRNGTAIFHLLENPLARNWWLREFMVQLPDFALKLNTWAVLALEIIFLPLALIKFTRKWVWLAMVFMHLGILSIVAFADLTIGMLMIHWFTFDSRWLSAKPKRTGVVFFDGVCGMCNSVVDLMLPEDHNDTLRFAPLQGSTAKEQLSQKDVANISTIIYQEGDKTYKQSDAVLKSFASLGGIWKLALIFRIIPRWIRDNVYKYIAANRYKWFGKKAACRIPTQEERAKFLP